MAQPCEKGKSMPSSRIHGLCTNTKVKPKLCFHYCSKEIEQEDTVLCGRINESLTSNVSICLFSYHVKNVNMFASGRMCDVARVKNVCLYCMQKKMEMCSGSYCAHEYCYWWRYFSSFFSSILRGDDEVHPLCTEHRTHAQSVSHI